jgi:O-antigen/teichoic acid export membrane protein
VIATPGCDKKRLGLATILPLVTRVRSGISWNVSSSLAGQFIGFLRSIILARLLAPEHFGLFTMALTIVSAANALTAIRIRPHHHRQQV